MPTLRLVPFALLFVASAGSAQSVSKTEGEVVVTGAPLSATKKALEECILQRCAVKQDVLVSLAHAENLFVAGRYQDARQVLLAARGRDGKYAAKYPIEVAGLMRANARMASLVGEPNLARIGMIDALDALRAGLPDNDPRVLLQKLEVGDAFAKSGRAEAAAQAYAKVSREAARLKLAAVEGHALFRIAILYSALADVAPIYASAARNACSKLEKNGNPALASFRQGTGLIRAMLSAQAGDKSKIEKAIAAFQQQAMQQPMLVYAPSIRLQSRERTGQSTIVNSRMPGDDHAQWLDIGFRIAIDGSVHDVAVLRRSDNAQDQYVQPILEALAQRRYTPPAHDAREASLFRVERYSIVSDVVMVTGTRIPSRSGNRRIEVLDLTPPAKQYGSVAVS